MVNYPTSLDTDGTLYDVADNIDDVLAVHHNALKDAVIAIETALGITGAFNFTTDAEMTTHEGNPTDLHHLTDVQLGALHTVVTTLTHTSLTGKNDEADIKHLTNAQQSALHTAVVAGDLNHNDLASIDAGDIKHLTAAQLGALHTVVVAGDLNHNDLANINAGESYEHITQTQKDALHAIYALTNDLAANEITAIQAIDDASINNTKWDYIAALTESPQTHMGAGNPHSGSAATGDLHSQNHDNADHTTNYETANANIQSHVGSPPEDSHHAKSHNNTEHSTNYETANANIQSHVGSPPSDSHHTEGHILTTVEGVHTGSLPLTDLGAGSTGSIIIAGAEDWEELVKGSNSNVLTLVSGYPAWVAQGAPGVHDIITGHNDTGLTIGHVITATAATTFAWQAPSAHAPAAHTMASHSDDNTYNINTTGTYTFGAAAEHLDLGNKDLYRVGIIKGIDQDHRIEMDPDTYMMHIRPGDGVNDYYFKLMSAGQTADYPMFNTNWDGAGRIGNSSIHWNYIYANYLKYDISCTIFDEHDDLALLDAMDVLRDDITGKPVLDAIGNPKADKKTMPEFLFGVTGRRDHEDPKENIDPTTTDVTERCLDLSATMGFSWGCIKQLHQKVKDQEAIISMLDARLVALEG